MSILRKIEKSPALSSFKEALVQEPALLMEHLWECPKALLIALSQQTLAKNILVITSEAKENRLLDDLAYFVPEKFHEFPAWETLPGEEIAPSPDIVGKRFEIAHTLLEDKSPHVLVCSLQACLQKLPNHTRLKTLFKKLEKGEELPFEYLPAFLTSLGYRRAPVVSDKGEFALRGSLIDIFPATSLRPYRIDFLNDTIDSIRVFDPGTQRTIEKIDALLLGPASEWELLKDEKEPSTLLDFLGKDTLVILDDLLALEDRLATFKSMPGANSRFFLTMHEFLAACASFKKLFWTKESLETLSEVHGKGKNLSFSMFGQEFLCTRFKHPFHEVVDHLSALDNRESLTLEEMVHLLPRLEKSSLTLHFLAQTESEERVFKEKVPVTANMQFEIAYLSSGFVLPDLNFALVPLTEFTQRFRIRRQKWRTVSHLPVSEFHELSPGDVVVHFHQGIGKYLGTEKRPNHLGQETEFLILEYAEKSKLYVPIAQSHLVSRYIGSHEEVPTFSVLGTSRWQKTKQNAQKAILGYAQDLLRMSAERELAGGFVFPDDGEELLSFERDFPFEETTDQLRAIQDVKKDMCTQKAMDRLVCGDVGYGKTEVAMRAAFKAVADGKKQVAVLVPTTVLALQHYETFCERMANYPLQIAHISRFSTTKEAHEILEKTEQGKIDILIGTHRLLSRDIRFKDLGLLVIDEEQRFGVRAKEKLKSMKAGVDCLTLTATPIPRTLYMTLVKAKEISIINTPPQDRLPVKTILAEREEGAIQNALLRELSRGGQVFFIHNRIDSIFHIASELQKLVPQARIVVGHGQMSSEELDAIFHSFKNGSSDILVSTTIVENGVDIPNANTVLVDRADTFGLADLYQIRGRVGRWNRPAYAYLLVPKKRELPEPARKRLQALQEASGFGGGLKIAMRDLEIRGAGDILGVEQSGQVSQIGFHLYCKLLKRTVEALKKKSDPSFYETKMEFAFRAHFPETYIQETSLRMELYHRLGEISTPEQADAILAEITDRFGPPPPEVLFLHHMTRLRLFASQHQFSLLKFDTRTLTFERKEVKKTMLLKEQKDPAKLEQEVLEILKLNI